MARKSGRKSRGRTVHRIGAGDGLQGFERWALRVVGKVLFLFVLLAFVFIGLSSNLMLISALAGIAVFLWGAVILPTDEFKDFGAWLWSGDAGEYLHGIWSRVIPWRGGR